jgi:hypothetical protein
MSEKLGISLTSNIATFKFSKEDDNTINENFEGLLNIGWYNGQIEELIKLYLYMIHELRAEETSIMFPEFLKDVDCNQYMRTVWSYLVYNTGDYGTSPRFGWINPSEENSNMPFDIMFHTYTKFVQEMIDMPEDISTGMSDDKYVTYYEKIFNEWINSRLQEGYLTFDADLWVF